MPDESVKEIVQRLRNLCDVEREALRKSLAWMTPDDWTYFADQIDAAAHNPDAAGDRFGPGALFRPALLSLAIIGFTVVAEHDLLGDADAFAPPFDWRDG